MKDFSTRAEQKLDKYYRLASLYKATNLNGTRKYLTQQIADAEGVSRQTVLRAAREFGVVQDHETANGSILHLKRPSRIRRSSY